VGPLREHQLADPGAGLDLDGSVDGEQALAASLVAGVPDGRVKHTAVAHERRPRVDEADVAFRNSNRLAVLGDVPASREDVRVGLRVRIDGCPLADVRVVAADPSTFP